MVDKESRARADAGLVALVFAAALAVRLLSLSAATAGGLRLLSPDCYGHLRRAASVARNFPRVPVFDPYLNHPDGDVASLKKHLVILEEREFEAMIKAESTENDLQSAKTRLELMQARLGNEHKKLIADQSALTMELERLADEREATLAPIDNRLLQTYEDLRQQKRGTAVAEINDNTCALCGTTLNAALQQNARSQQLAYCSSCGRILYSH